jgi:hypothetical protein
MQLEGREEVPTKGRNFKSGPSKTSKIATDV